MRSEVYIVSALVTFVEVHAALERASRAGRLTDLSTAVREFEVFWERVIAVAVDGLLVSSAARVAHRHRLRAHDAVQLAAAMVARQGARAVLPFGSFDDELNRAAAGEGFALL